MRRIVAFATVLAMSLTGVPLFAASASVGRRPQTVASGQTQTGNVNGTAEDSKKKKLGGYMVRLRSTEGSGALSGTTTTGADGAFSFTGVAPGSYVVEIVDSNGLIVGTSASLTITAGSTVSGLVVSSSAAGLLGAAGGAAAVGGGMSTTAIVITTVAVAGGVAGAVAIARANASPSR